MKYMSELLSVGLSLDGGSLTQLSLDGNLITKSITSEFLQEVRYLWSG